MMDAFICQTCGIQYSPSSTPPGFCKICTEERQYVPPSGQLWTTLPQLRLTHMPTVREEAGLIGFGTCPTFGIGQRALLVRSRAANVLWDCISLLDAASVHILNGLGGLQAIAISHPHFYTAMVEWSHAFGGIPVYVHAADREWIMRPDPCLVIWDGETREIASGLVLIRCGGHFAGGTVMHWAAGAGGRGALFSGDLLQVVADRTHVGFMRSYPNFMPLGAAAVRRVAAKVAPFSFDAIYGAFWDRVIATGAKRAIAASVERHLAWLERDAI
jgi:hypothetical protein